MQVLRPVPGYGFSQARNRKRYFMFSRISAILLATCITVPTAIQQAHADRADPPRKTFNFGSRSFDDNDNGWTKRQQRQQRRRDSNVRSFDFFGGNRGFFTTGDDLRAFEEELNRRNTDRVRVRITEDDGPDAGSTGERYHTYVADKLVRLARPGLKQPRPQGPVFSAEAGATIDVSDQLDTIELTDKVAQATFEALKAGIDGIGVSARQLEAIAKAYESRQYKPIWIEDGKPSARAEAVLKVLSEAEQEGLKASWYALPVLDSARTVAGLPGDPATLARFELELTAMALRYAHHASGGLVTPNKISGYHDMAPPHVAAADAIASLVSHPEPAGWLMRLHPTLPAYKAMKAELIALGANETEPQIVVPEGKLLQLGVSDERVPILRKRLKQLKFIKASDEVAQSGLIATDVPLFGSEAAMLAADSQALEMSDTDVAALKAFQTKAGLKADGMAGRRTIAALNGNSTVDRSAQLALNMERLRWLPRNLGKRYIFVNQPSFELRIMRDDNSIEWSTRVIVGKLSNQTYVFSDEMERVEFNPYWGLPQSIIRGQYLSKLRSNPGYFEQRGYEVINSRGQKIAGSSVDWWNYKGVGVRQKPGPNNALGEVKFMFPNSHAIYLHDTPKRSLFENESRAFSHGCVRVDNPRNLARHILGWSDEKVASTIATGKHTVVNMQNKLPVHLTYFTAWTDENGNLTYYSDVYNRDSYLAKAVDAERTELSRRL
jgi:L,D-transpeptidase YcbB